MTLGIAVVIFAGCVFFGFLQVVRYLWQLHRRIEWLEEQADEAEKEAT